MGWTVFATSFERLIALAQSFFIARLLGADEYGRYGLVYATAGLIASLAGLQLGLTATVHVSKFARTDPEFAGGVVRLCELTAVTSTLIAVGLLLFAPGWFAAQLLGGRAYAGVLALAAVIVLFSVFGGVQDGVLQGFEQFRGLALTRVGVTLTGFLLLLWLARAHDLHRILEVLTFGTILRTIVVFGMKERQWRKSGLHASMKSIWGARRVLFSFSVPSMLASLIGGGITWYATLIVSKVRDGFHGVAFLTAGQQWRGTVLFGATFMASVAVPMISRLLHAGDTVAALRLHRANLILTVTLGVLIVAVVCAGSGFILKGYGTGFEAGRVVFWLSVLAAIPAVYTTVMLQILVTRSMMWGQLVYYMINYIPLLIGYILFVPRFGATGFAVVTLAVNLVYCILLHVRLSKYLVPDAVQAGSII
jgi:O-antigen/teichoic acid export membrane protein